MRLARALGMVNTICMVLALLTLSFILTESGFAAEQNLLLNGDLSAGAGDIPQNWSMTAGASIGSFGWFHPKHAPGALEIGTNEGALRYSYWTQKIILAEAAWYRLRAEVKTEGSSTNAVIKVWGARSSDLAVQSSSDWAPMEVYFRIASANGTVELGFGLRAPPGGRAYFRKLALYKSFGPPPDGSRQLDIATDFDELLRPKIHQFVPEDVSQKGGPLRSLNGMMSVASMPASEKAALLGVEAAKPPADESLLHDILSVRVIAVALLLLTTLTYLDVRYSMNTSDAGVGQRYFANPQLKWSAGVAACLTLMLLGTWLTTRIEYLPGHGFYVVEPRAVAGDEPHYLVMINSLLFTHKLELQTLYDDVEQGGPEAGVMSRGAKLDRHTIVVNRRTGHRAMGTVVGEKWHRNPAAEFAPSPDVYEISVHPAGFPILMALMLAPMRPSPSQVEPDVGFLLVSIAWLGIVLTYFVGRQSGMSRGWAILAAAILFAASPWLGYSRSFFAESSIGLALIVSLWAMVYDLPIFAALAVGAAAIMKAPFGLAGVGFVIEKMREKRWRDAITIALILGAPALMIVTHDFWLHRRFFALSQLVSTLTDPVEGLLLYAPWTIFGFAMCARAFVSQSQELRLARMMALPLFLYLLVVSSIGFGVGYAYGPRYWVAFLPWLALATVEAIRRAGKYQRLVCAMLIFFAMAIAIPGALRYPQLFESPVLEAWRGFH
jgi:hypothetical protein